MGERKHVLEWPPLLPLLWLYSAWCYLVFVLLMPPMVVYYLLVSFLAGRNVERKLLYANNAVAMIWAVLTGHGMRLTRHPDYTGQACVVAPNHASTLDMLIISFSLRNGVRLLVKKELRNNFLLGPLFRQIAIFVDRADPASRKEAMIELGKLTKRGVSLLIFPEGTRNRTAEPLGPFYDGAFRQAIQAQIPVVPMVLMNTRRLMPISKWTILPGVLRAEYLAPVPTEGLTEEDVVSLREEVRQLMLDRLATA